MIRLPTLLLAFASLHLGGCQVLFKDDAAKDLAVAQEEASPNALRPAETAPGQSKPSAEDLPLPQTAETLPSRSATAKKEPTARERLDALVTDFGKDVELPLQSPLQLEQVKQSVVEKLPLIQSVIQEAQVAAGKQQAARGAFDVKLVAESLNTPLSFYKNYRHLVKAEQATWKGGAVYGQYRIGDGDFPPWYGERETNEGGEFKLGFVTPLLRGRDIDERRAEIARADLAAAAVNPQVQRQLLESVQLSAYVYWSWVAAGQAYLITQDLLEVAEDRDRAIRRQVELGNLGLTEQQQNERLIASRQAKLVEARRKLESAAIKLSLFLRDDAGDPIIPGPSNLPTRFPEPADPAGFDLNADIGLALDQRPELRELQLARQMVNVDLQLSENELLPNLSAIIEASKDVGAPASSKGDKTPFELEAGLVFDVPVQRNKASGKIQSARGKLTQVALKQQYTADKIVTDVQDAHSALTTAFERVEITRRNVELARQLVKAEYRSFELGNSDVLRIAIQEGAELDARYLEIEALLDYYQALAQYQAAIANR
jgi:outer membrane protein TolC